MLIGDTAGSDSGVFLKRRTVPPEQINGMNPVMVDHKKECLERCAVPGITLLIMVVKEKTWLFIRLKFGKKVRKGRIFRIQFKKLGIGGKVLLIGDVMAGIVIAHFTIRIVRDDGAARRASAAGKEGSGFNAEIGEIGIENCFIAVKSMNLESTDFSGHNLMMIVSINVHIALPPIRKDHKKL